MDQALRRHPRHGDPFKQGKPAGKMALNEENMCFFQGNYMDFYGFLWIYS
jgi:hypothetical protein